MKATAGQTTRGWGRGIKHRKLLFSESYYSHNVNSEITVDYKLVDTCPYIYGGNILGTPIPPFYAFMLDSSFRYTMELYVL